jgi:lysophospholipase L1-like esterase
MRVGIGIQLTLILLLVLAGCNDQPALAPIPRDGTILAFGDSLTYGTGVTASQSYPAVLQTLTGYEVVRSGVPGEVSSAGLKRLELVLRKIRPDLVILCHGGNDILRRMPGTTTRSNLDRMVKLVRRQGAQAVLIAVPKLGLFPEAQDYYETLREDLQVPVQFDIIADLERDRAMKSDQIHFNQQGYRLLAEAVHDLLRQTGAL